MRQDRNKHLAVNSINMYIKSTVWQLELLVPVSRMSFDLVNWDSYFSLREKIWSIYHSRWPSINLLLFIYVALNGGTRKSSCQMMWCLESYILTVQCRGNRKSRFIYLLSISSHFLWKCFFRYVFVFVSCFGLENIVQWCHSIPQPIYFLKMHVINTLISHLGIRYTGFFVWFQILMYEVCLCCVIWYTLILFHITSR